MKKTVLTIFTLLNICLLKAQTLTEANNSPSPWDYPYSTIQFDSLTITPGASGLGATWSYTPTGLNVVKNYSKSLNTNLLYPQAYTSVGSATNNVSYYSSSSSSLKYHGGYISVGGYDVNLIYSSPAMFMSYPMALNTTTNSTIAGTLTVLGQSGSFSGSCNVIADGTGTLALPTKTFTDIVRTVTSQTINAVLSGGAITAVVIQKNYDYYSPSASKAPIFSISSSSLTSSVGAPQSQTLVTVMKDYNVVGIKENTKETIQLSVFPNPASSSINFSTLSNDAVKVMAYDVTGKLVSTELFEAGVAKMTISHLNSGMYLYSVLGKNNQVLTSGKFNVVE